MCQKKVKEKKKKKKEKTIPHKDVKAVCVARLGTCFKLQELKSLFKKQSTKKRRGRKNTVIRNSALFINHDHELQKELGPNGTKTTKF